ncbi:hypothetical protein ACFFW8_01380 [Erwinia tracheiphila]
MREMGFLSQENIGELLKNLTGDNLRTAKLSPATGGRWGEITSLSRKSVIKYKVTYLKNKERQKNRTVPVSPTLWKENHHRQRAASVSASKL